MDNKKRAKIIKVFIVLYVLSFMLVNWNDVSWLFNYKAILGLLDDFFTPYPSIKASFLINNSFYPNYGANQNSNNKIDFVYTDKENSLEISAIGIYAPIVLSQSTDKNSLAKDLDKGVVYYPGSVLPGQKGQIVILGHSAPLNWPKIKHDWVFSDLNDLESGDKIIINLDHKQYIYTVKEKTIIKKGGEIAPETSMESNNNLTLISCWPPGKNIQRIVVQAALDTI